MTLVEFIRARLAEVPSGIYGQSFDDPHTFVEVMLRVVLIHTTEANADSPFWRDHNHECPKWQWRDPDPDPDDGPDPWRVDTGYTDDCQTLRLVGSWWADHPDYDVDRWAPDPDPITEAAAAETS